MIIKISRLRLLGVLLFHIQGAGMQGLLNHWEILMSFFNKVSALQPANAIKTKFPQTVFKNFACFLETAYLRNNSFCLQVRIILIECTISSVWF